MKWLRGLFDRLASGRVPSSPGPESVRPGTALVSPEEGAAIWQRLTDVRARAINNGEWYEGNPKIDAELARAAHVHVWEPPPMDFSSRDAINMLLVGSQCKCGAIREYLGPAYGYRITEPQTPNVARSEAVQAEDRGKAKP